MKFERAPQFVGGAVPYEDGQLDFSHLSARELLELQEYTRSNILESGEHYLLEQIDEAVREMYEEEEACLSNLK